jgi:hypothetical protein
MAILHPAPNTKTQKNKWMGPTPNHANAKAALSFGYYRMKQL